ncbi:hypothetical protein PRBEI_2001182300 [Prionailurus iriomotensis]
MMPTDVLRVEFMERVKDASSFFVYTTKRPPELTGMVTHNLLICSEV